MAKYLEAEKTLVKRPQKRTEASSALPSAADLDFDAEEKATAVATNDSMPEASAGAKALNNNSRQYQQSSRLVIWRGGCAKSPEADRFVISPELPC